MEPLTVRISEPVLLYCICGAIPCTEGKRKTHLTKVHETRKATPCAKDIFSAGRCLEILFIQTTYHKLQMRECPLRLLPQVPPSRYYAIHKTMENVKPGTKHGRETTEAILLYVARNKAMANCPPDTLTMCCEGTIEGTRFFLPKNCISKKFSVRTWNTEPSC